MNLSLRLGALFISIIAGGVISAATSFYSTLFVGEQLPFRWWWLATSASVLLFSGCMWAYVAVLIADIEGSFRAIPRELPAPRREEIRRALTDPVRVKVGVIVWISISTSAIGFGSVALRFVPLSS